jgi:hypothetical protein
MYVHLLFLLLGFQTYSPKEITGSFEARNERQPNPKAAALQYYHELEV